MKTIISSIDTVKLPAVYFDIRKDVLDFFNTHKNKEELKPIGFNKNRGNIYFFKQYQLDLWGWSGLDNWFNGLLKRKIDSSTLKLFDHIYLDPQLCLRRIQDVDYEKFENLEKQIEEQVEKQVEKYKFKDKAKQELFKAKAKQKLLKKKKQILRDQFLEKFWNSNKQQNSDNNQMKMAVMICDEIPTNQKSKNSREIITEIGKYQQQQMMITLSYWQLVDKLSQIKKTLVHQFVHFLDHLTGLIIKENINQLVQHEDVFLPKSADKQLYKSSNQKKQHEQKQNKQYYAELQQLSLQLDQICRDYAFRFKEYDAPGDEILLYYCYLTEYNLNKKQSLDREKLETLLISKGWKKLVDLFKYLSDQSDHENFYNEITELGKEAIVELYNRYKSIYFVDTQLSREILNNI